VLQLLHNYQHLQRVFGMLLQSKRRKRSSSKHKKEKDKKRRKEKKHKKQKDKDKQRKKRKQAASSDEEGGGKARQKLTHTEVRQRGVAGLCAACCMLVQPLMQAVSFLSSTCQCAGTGEWAAVVLRLLDACVHHCLSHGVSAAVVRLCLVQGCMCTNIEPTTWIVINGDKPGRSSLSRSHLRFDVLSV
jgi:hypothetical protein